MSNNDDVGQLKVGHKANRVTLFNFLILFWSLPHHYQGNIYYNTEKIHWVHKKTEEGDKNHIGFVGSLSGYIWPIMALR